MSDSTADLDMRERSLMPAAGSPWPGPKDEKPLFIPLRREHYEAFATGTKPGMEKLRPCGARWNTKTCRVGRPVILSLGYGRQHRLQGWVSGYRVDISQVHLSPAWVAIYGPGPCAVACIKIALEVARG